MEGRFGKKNVVAIAVICGLLLVGATFIKHQLKERVGTTTITVGDDYTSVNTNTLASIDSDNDGLRDWEEVLLKTDPNLADTDGDGTSDGDEIAQDRDPLISGPNDTSTGSSQGISREMVESLPDTEKLAFKLFEGYIDLKQRGYLGTSIEENFVSSLVGSNVVPITAPINTADDVLISPEVTPEAYRASLQSAWSPLFNVKEDELITFTRIIDSGDESGFTKLQYAKAQYEATITLLKGVAVPTDAVSIHVDMLNAFSFFVSVLDAMANTNSDPLAALTAISGYTEGEAKIKAALGRLNTYLIINSVDS
ncbi:MAG: thrombospondin type 3 repeat-containing protein [Candidatus Pacebacteria bacterium]|nr:thrombospondin type 3 repeat-containing protein [Candidatus Paceibacterota bacterium]